MATVRPTSGRMVEKELFLRASPERVFRALTDKAELERWFVSRAEVDARPGGAFSFTWQPHEMVNGRFVAVEPPHRLVTVWDEGPSLGFTEVTFELTPQGGGTLLRLVHTGFGEGDDWDRLYTDIQSGWNSKLEHLRDWLDEGRPKAWS